ncbi:MAG: outer membrane lipoprotein-sorting protein [Spirochaetaceae bacterium]
MKKIVFILIILTAMVRAYAIDVNEIISKADASFKLKRLYSETEITIERNGKKQPTQIVLGYSTIEDGINYSLSIYQSPKKMKGNANLMVGDDLWVKFASTGRVRKLSSSAKKNSSGGSDFSYEDMGSGGEGMASNYTLNLVGDKKIDGVSCYQIELTPINRKNSGYDKLLTYIDKESFKYIKIEYFKDGANIKTLFLSDYRVINSVDFPFIMTMKNNVKNSITTMKTTQVEFNSDKVKNSLFTQSYLKRVK